MRVGKGVHGLCRRPIIAWRDAAEYMLQNGQTLAAFAAHHGHEVAQLRHLRSIRLPAVSATLAQKKLWSHALGFMRWKEFHPFVPVSLRPLPAGSQHEPLLQDDSLSMSADRSRQSAQRVREWSFMVLEHPHGEEHRIALVQEVKYFTKCARSLTGGGSHCEDHFVYSAPIMAEVVRMSLLVRGHNFDFVIRRAMSMSLLPGVASAVEQFLNNSAKPILHGKSTIHRARLSLDVALMLTIRRAVASMPRVVRFGWADSSPQHQRDWLLSAHDWIKWEDLPKVAEAANGLVKLRLEREQRRRDGDDSSDSDRDGAVAGDKHDSTERWHETLFSCIHRHDHPPAALGHCATSLAHKIAALCHVWSLEVGAQCLARFSQRCFSFATDMGTELGISEFAKQKPLDLLPYWMRKLSVVSDVDDGNASSAAQQLAASDCDLPSVFLPNSFTIPVMLHICYNLCSEVNQSPSYWKTFFGQLKVMEMLISYRFRRELFISTCLLGTMWEDEQSSFERFSCRLYEARWGEVLDFVSRFPSSFDSARRGLGRSNMSTGHERLRRGRRRRAQVQPQGRYEGHQRQDVRCLSSFGHLAWRHTAGSC